MAQKGSTPGRVKINFTALKRDRGNERKIQKDKEAETEGEREEEGTV